jgi:tRNA pseudouridine55 synthase
MDGVLLIDKPVGLTSHDVVARVRAASGERRVGHTGTLDPLATGLLPLVLGRATRLASLFSGRDKTYEAAVALGQFTDTDDREGDPVGPPYEGPIDPNAVALALERFRGTFAQQPPRHSAKKIGGRPAYELARRDQPVTLAPVTVTVHALELVDLVDRTLTLRLTVSSGFYVRALARDLGEMLGCGAHLAALRRTAIDPFPVEQAMSLADAIALGPAVADRLIPPAAALPGLPAVVVTASGLTRVRHGNPIGPAHVAGPWAVPPAPASVKILTDEGQLAALGRLRGALLHPVVVLG